ncbi:hypothetical protein RB195_004061 [Necator americanus]|uniref:Uncharacterized protein n=1 Tax=Necator americanus TaxID=51031 RepID=A0ABR1BG54_NECAM
MVRAAQVDAVKVSSVPSPTSSVAADQPRSRIILIVAVATGALAGAMLLIYYRKRMDRNREIFENKVINPARVKKRSRLKSGRSSSSASSKSPG